MSFCGQQMAFVTTTTCFYFSLSESECGGGTGCGGSSESQSPVTMGMQFGTLWGGANGDMLAGMYDNSGDDATNGDEDNAYGGSEASNDSNSNMQPALAT